MKLLAVDKKESSHEISVDNLKQYFKRSEDTRHRFVQVDIGWDCRLMLSPKGVSQLCAALIVAVSDEQEYQPE